MTDSLALRALKEQLTVIVVGPFNLYMASVTSKGRIWVVSCSLTKLVGRYNEEFSMELRSTGSKREK